MTDSAPSTSAAQAIPKLLAMLVFSLICFAVSISLFTYLLGFWPSSVEFTDEAIAQIKGEITHEYSNRSIVMKKLEMLRESKRKLVGFALAETSEGETLNLSCSATMSDDGKKSFWQCK